jgi:3-isopropylmalate/(R)-2-methylmalate dehydratase small subunit
MEPLVRTGKAWRFGDRIDTDQIYPGKYMHVSKPAEAAEHLMEGVDPQFARNAEPGDFLVAGKNFGLGSIRGGIHLAFEQLKLGGILAESFSRSFFRNCISEGIPVLECPGLGGRIETGDRIQVNFSEGAVENLTKNKRIQGIRLPDFIIERVVIGGSVPYLKKILSG